MALTSDVQLQPGVVNICVSSPTCSALLVAAQAAQHPGKAGGGGWVGQGWACPPEGRLRDGVEPWSPQGRLPILTTMSVTLEKRLEPSKSWPKPRHTFEIT